ncbi:GntR family transcriptional regulator [Tabrizicola sp. WMC-M-20]|nr:GntR family transcriptional regulator [Tabrizicola sp. WMC-M-20]
MKDNRPAASATATNADETGTGPEVCTIQPQGDQSDQAYRALVDGLRGGTLRSGMFLSMPMLVTHLAFPLAAVREAVKRAEAAALVQILPKRGVMVMTADPDTTRDCMDLRTMLDLHGARRLLAGAGALPLAALRATHEALLHDATAPAPDLQRRAITTDLSLHDALSTGLDGPVLRRLYAENRDRIAVIQTQRPFLADRIIPAMTEHLAIITALETGDLPAVETAIRDHLTNTLRWWGIDSR